MRRPPRSTLFPYTTLFRSTTCRSKSSVHPRAAADRIRDAVPRPWSPREDGFAAQRSEEHTSELQSRFDLVCRLLLEKKKEPPLACRAFSLVYARFECSPHS